QFSFSRSVGYRLASVSGRTGRRRAVRPRSASTATIPVTSAAAAAIAAICQPGMPPTTTVWTTVAGAVAPSWLPLPPTGIIDVDAEALLAKLTAMTARLASTAPSRLRLLMVLIEWFSLPGSPGRGRGRQPGPLAFLTLRRYGATTAFRIGSITQFLRSGSPVFAGQASSAARGAALLR